METHVNLNEGQPLAYSHYLNLDFHDSNFCVCPYPGILEMYFSISFTC